MSDRQILISIIIMSAVTAAIRFIPFIVLNGKKTPEWINYLGKYLPYAVMGMLVVYCLKGISFKQASTFVPELVSAAVTAGLYVWKKNTLLSIITGTVIYMILVQFIFV